MVRAGDQRVLAIHPSHPCRTRTRAPDEFESSSAGVGVASVCQRAGSVEPLGKALIREQADSSAGVGVERREVQVDALQRPVITAHTLWQDE